MAITWEEPVTTWGNGDYYTRFDWNRVVRDTGWLLDKVDYPLYDEEGFLNAHLVQGNDFLRAGSWQTIRLLLLILWNREHLPGDPTEPGDEMTADNFNAMETLLLRIKDYLELLERQAQAEIYAGDGFYTAHTGIYPDVSEEYTR